MKIKFNKMGNSKSFIVIIFLAIALATGAFIYLKANDVKVYVVNEDIPVGTKITTSMLAEGIISLKEVPGTIVNKYVVSDFSKINNMYTKENLRPGKMIFSYDIAKETNLRSNEILTTYNLEAVTIKANQQEGIANAVNKGDKVNVYGTYNYDLSPLFEANLIEGENEENGEVKEIVGIPITSLSPEIQKVFFENGYKEDTFINTKDITITKLLLQNIPIVDVQKNEQEEIISVTLGLEPEYAEVVYLTLKTGQISLSVLPYFDGDYVEKETKGAISFKELKTTGIIHDVNIIKEIEE